jgi:hypothetical protein
MMLRDHPGMSFHGVSNWPPVWVHARANGQKQLTGEIGVLKYVHASNRLSNKCYLVMEHDNIQYVGCLIFNDATFCYQVANTLRTHLGRSIKELGDVDLAGLF